MARVRYIHGNSLVHVWKDPTSPEPTAPRAYVLVQKPHTSVFSGVYDDHLGPSNSENDNETIKNRGDYVETTIKGPDYLTSRIYRQRFNISAEQKKEEKWKLLLFSKVVLIVTFRRTWSRNISCNEEIFVKIKWTKFIDFSCYRLFFINSINFVTN